MNIELKKNLRHEFLSKRNNMSLSEMERQNKQIQTLFFNLELYKSCDFIFTYINMGNEVNTKNIVNRALIDGKRIAVPKIVEGNRKMIFVEINSLDSLVKNKFDILEPESFEDIPSSAKTIFLVPALVFDSKNYRIGYGGGYYDRYLATAEFLLKIGLAYDFQIVDTIPSDEYDIAVDLIVKGS